MPKKKAFINKGDFAALLEMRKKETKMTGVNVEKSIVGNDVINDVILKQLEYEAAQNRRRQADRERKRSAREKETEAERNARLQSDKVSKSTVRGKENEAKRNSRLVSDKVGKATARDKEAEAERKARLVSDKVGKATARDKETEAERKARLVSDKVGKATARNKETEAERKARLVSDKVGKATARDKETEAERNVRLESAKRGMTVTREKETAAERKARLVSDKVGKATARDKETEAERNVRLESAKRGMTVTREKETAAERKARLVSDKVGKATARDKETKAERNVRLESAKRGMTVTREKETAAERKARLVSDKVGKATARDKETEAERNVRLQSAKREMTVTRENETAAERKARLVSDKVGKATAREKETQAERNLRLQSDKVAKSTTRNKETEAERKARLEKDKLLKMSRRRSDRISMSFQRAATDPQSAGRKSKKRKGVGNRVKKSRKLNNNSRLPSGANSTDCGPEVSDAADSCEDDEFTFSSDMITAEFQADAANEFFCKMWDMESTFCPACKERFPDIKIDKKKMVCQKCCRSGHKYTGANDMDPGDIPPQLQGLRVLEQILIARVVSTMCVYRRPLGQYGYSGNVINFPQEIESLVDVLPRLATDVHVLVLRKKGNSGTFKDFQVRRDKVSEALKWLSQNNIYYKDIVISEERLSRLPHDGEIPLAEIDEADDACEEQNEELGDSDSSADEHAMVHEPTEHPAHSTFVPLGVVTRKEAEYKEKEVEQVLYGHGDVPLPWPALDTANPVAEFGADGLVAMNFPHLLPYGRADLNESGRTETPVSPLEYFRHMIRYDDARFARDPRFRYFALNMLLRHRALAAGRVFVKQNPDVAELRIEDLKSMGRQDKSQLLKQISRYGQTLPGSKQYWGARRQELLEMIKQKNKLPTIFFTLSAADLQWPDLHRLLPGYASKTEAVIENPLMCTWFFIERVKYLLQTVFKEDLGCEDYWGRFEFQHRGSIHFHGLAWLKNAPDVTSITPETSAEMLNEFVDYFDEIVSAVNPAFDANGDGDVPLIKRNPSSVPYLKVQSTIEAKMLDHIGLVVYCHKHVCRSAYCQRVVAGQKKCRFNFPFELQQLSKIEVNINEKTGAKTVDFIMKRNDPNMCPLNWRVAESHRANTNVQPVVCKRHLVGYCTKYVCKSELQSEMLQLLTNQALSVTNPHDPMRQIAQKLLNMIVGGRDYSAQETMMLLSGYPQYLSSRTFVSLYLSGTRELCEEDGEPVIVSSLIDKYCSLRPKDLESVCLIDFYRNHFFRLDGSVGNKRQPAIVVPKSLRRVDRDSPLFEEYARGFLMLHKPFRDLVALRGSYSSYGHAMESFQASVPLNEFDLHEEVQQAESVPADRDENAELEPEVVAANRVPADFAQLLEANPRFRAEVDHGRDFDWCEAYGHNPRYGALKEFYDEVADYEDVETYEHVDLSQMNEKQRVVHNEVVEHAKSNVDQGPLRKIVTGTAGTGKSFLINCLKKTLGNRLLVMGPTGVSASNVGGHTINAALKIPVVSPDSFVDLRGPALEMLQERLDHIDYIIIDEMSMVGLSKLGMIDRRLRQAFPVRSRQYFGGCSIILIGDFGQLPPPGDLRMYNRRPKKDKELQCGGARAYRSFNSCTILDVVVRQQGDEGFRDLLQRIRIGQFNRNDYELLKTRFIGRLGRREYSSATHLFTKNEDVLQHNIEKLGHLEQPIAMINSVNLGGSVANNALADDARGLDRFVLLAKGAKIMLTANLNIAAGLCNGTVGTIVDIVYSQGGPPGLPLCVLCDFPAYRGPAFVPSQPTFFPVAPVTRRFTKNAIECTRTMLPLRLAWAVTVHKSQGLTLDTMVVDFGKSEFSTGLAFVALSRVRKLADLAVHAFPYQRLGNIGSVRQSAATIANLKKEDLGLYRMSALILSSESEISPGSNPSSTPLTPLSTSPRLRTPDTVRLLPSAPSVDMTVSVPGDCLAFRPLCVSDQQKICDRLEIPYQSNLAPVVMEDVDSSMFSKPRSKVNVQGDGNCFYHVLSLAISNSHENHGRIRDTMETYLRSNRDELLRHGWDANFHEITLLDISTNGSYAGEGEMVVAAKTLGCSVYVFGHTASEGYRWRAYQPDVAACISHRGIYIFHCTMDMEESNDANHYCLVTSL